MFRELNRKLRKIVIITGAVILVTHLVNETGAHDEEKEKTDDGGYQRREFDDIW